MTYFANFTTSSGSYFSSPLSDSNMSRLIKAISTVSNGNRLSDGTCSWYVHDVFGHCVAYGYTLASGKRCRLFGLDLRNFDF